MAQDERSNESCNELLGHSTAAISPSKAGDVLPGVGNTFAAHAGEAAWSMTAHLVTDSHRADFGFEFSLSYGSGIGLARFDFGWSPTLPSIQGTGFAGVMEATTDSTGKPRTSLTSPGRLFVARA